MSGLNQPGIVGNLTADQESKLKTTWIHLFRLCGIESILAKPLNPVLDQSDEFRQRLLNSLSDGPIKSLFAGVRTRRLAHLMHWPNNFDTSAFASVPDRSEEFRRHLVDKTPEGFAKNLLLIFRAEHPDGLALRFLRARKFDVEKAVVMMVSAISWRDEHRIDTELIFNGESVGLRESPSADDRGFIEQYRSGKSYVRGTDKGGRPVYIIRVRLHDPSLQSAEAMEKYILHNVESIRALVKAPYDQVCLIFDMTGFGLRNMDFYVVKFLLQVFEARYPETLGVVLIHNAPFVFWGLWKMIKGWLDPVVASKINFTSSAADMARFIDKKNLQKSYGGDNDWEYEYIEAVPGENSELEHVDKAATLLEERIENAIEFVRLTVDWASASPGAGTGSGTVSKREEAILKIQENYWKLDVHIRAKTYLHRAGVVNEQGEVDFMGAGRVKHSKLGP